jgi:ABC-type multidrug transport system fused ATPase/permease subunit
MSDLTLKLAIALLPPSRKAWGKAMKAEFAHLGEGQTGFAWGCLGASLKENVTTGEGWARLGLGLVTAFCLGFSALWIQGVFKILSDHGSISTPRLIHALTLEGFGLFPLAFGFAALKATRAPTNRFHLASIAHSTVLISLTIAGVLQVFLCAGSVLFFMTVEPIHYQTIQNTLEYGIYGSLLFLSVAWFARKSAHSMRRAGFIATLVLIGFAILVSIQNADHPGVILKGVLPTTLFFAFLMTLTAIAGALSMWMGRSARPASQP